MREEIKRKWLEYLRSGKFIRRVGRLKSRNLITNECKHCVLGVLCEVFADMLENPMCSVAQSYMGMEFYKSQDWTKEDDDRYLVEVTEIDGSFHPSARVMNWAGLNDSVFLKYEDKWEPIHVLNDRGMEFSQLADLIEAQL